jgi:hypothetical protein
LPSEKKVEFVKNYLKRKQIFRALKNRAVKGFVYEKLALL